MIPTGQKNGYLDVKIPAKVRGKGIKAWKAWKKRWVVVRGMTNVSTQNPIATMDMYSHENQEGHQLERTTIYLERVVGIQRTPSKSRQYAFSVEADTALVYLSGSSETDSQEWISALRGILWPSPSKPCLDCCIGKVFNVSIIETLSRVAPSPPSSPVGFMITLPSVVLLASANTGCISVEWPRPQIKSVTMAQVTNHEDVGKIISIEITSDIPNSGLYHLFSEKAQDIYKTLTRGAKPDTLHKTLTSSVEYRTNPHSTGTTSMKPGISPSIRNHPLNEDRWKKSTSLNSENQDSDSDQCSDQIELDCVGQCDLAEVPVAYRPEKKPPQIGKGYNVSLEIIPSNDRKFLTSSAAPLVQFSAMTRRKSCSDSALANQKSDYGTPSPCRISILSRSSKSDQSNSEYEEIADNLMEQFNFSPVRNTDGEKDHLQVSSPSETSQVSRDSGIILSSNEESGNISQQETRSAEPKKNTYELEDDFKKRDIDSSNAEWALMADTDESKRHYRKFADLISESQTALWNQLQPERMSVASDTTVYSQVDTFPDITKDDPLYEDLDKFRKDIHKLLGITLRSEKPPPLPPRKYSKGNPLLGSARQVRRKDVMKYLGVDSESYGSLDKLSIDRKPSVSYGTQKRKNIYKYLGIPSMAASQPLGLDDPEQMYDSPRSQQSRKTSVEENNSGRSSRTYVRVRPIVPATTAKPVKKRPMSFLKTRKLSVGSKASETKTNNTYVSLDCGTNDDWENAKSLITNDDKTLARMGSKSRVATVPEQNLKTEQLVGEQSVGDSESGENSILRENVPLFSERTKISKCQTLPSLALHRPHAGLQFEQYSVPSGCRSSVNLPPLTSSRNSIQMNQPVYINMGDLQSTLDSIHEDDLLVQETKPLTIIGRNETEAVSAKTGAEPISSGESHEDANNSSLILEESEDDSDDSEYLDMTGTLQRDFNPLCNWVESGHGKRQEDCTSSGREQKPNKNHVQLTAAKESDSVSDNGDSSQKGDESPLMTSCRDSGPSFNNKQETMDMPEIRLVGNDDTFALNEMAGLLDEAAGGPQSIEDMSTLVKPNGIPKMNTQPCSETIQSTVGISSEGNLDKSSVAKGDMGTAIRTRLSSYIDELFEQSLMEYENHVPKPPGSQANE